MKFTPDEMRYYEESLKHYRDMKNSLDTAREEGEAKGIEKGIEKGREEGREEEKREIAREMLSENEPIEKIMRFTGLTREQIEKLK